MNKFYFYNIILNLKRNMKINVMLGIIMMFITIFLSFCHFFSFDKKIVNNIANQLELNIEIKDNNIFGLKYANIHKKHSIDEEYFNKFVNVLRYQGNKEEFLHYGFSINVSTNCFNENGEHKGRISLNGIENIETFETYNKFLISGRYLTQEEIDNGIQYAVVTDDQGFNVGDKIKIGNIFTNFEDKLNDVLEIEVIGIVNTEKTNLIEYDIINKERKLNGVFISNNIFLNLINENNGCNDFSNIMISNIYYKVKDYNNYGNAKENLIKYFNKYDFDLESKGLEMSNLKVEQSNVEIIIESILRIHNIYQIIFILCILLSISLLFSVMIYIIKKNLYEIRIYRCLGQKKILIIMHYLLTYSIVTFLFSLIGIIAVDYISQGLYQLLISNGMELQSNLLSLSDIRYDAIQLVPAYNRIYEDAILIVCEVFFVLVSSVCLAMYKVLKRT